MIKRYSVNKLIVASFSLFLICLISILPQDKLNVNTSIEEKDNYNNVVYLLDEDEYVSMINIYIGKNEIEDIVKEKLILLRDGSEDYPNFNTLIPKDTIINSISVKEDSVYIDFSNEFLSIKSSLEESMIEGIVYSITEINGINNIYIYVEGNEINKFPNGGYEVVLPLTRTIGINKEYDLEKLSDVTKTTMYFIKENEDTKYYVPVTKVSNNMNEKISIIISELKSSIYSVDNLQSYLSNKLLLDSYNVTEDTMNLVFNDYIFESIGSKTILEEVKYVISESVFENYNVNNIVFSTKDNVIETIEKY